jgi:uncharacterized damage-inducible protein DinB
MSDLALTAEEILAWNDGMAAQWKALAESHAELLGLPCDIYHAGTVAKLLQHIVAVELRYTQRLAGDTETPYEEVPFGSAEEIFSVHDRALAGIRALLADSVYDWSVELEFNTISAGRLRASRKTMLFHMLLHSVRHYAQLATHIRQQGFSAGFAMDYLTMGAKPALASPA